MPVTGSSDFVPESAIDPLLIKAYSEFEDKSIDGACQRDYVYYGMSKSNTDHGVYRGYIREQLYRFKISKGTYGFIADQNDDPKLHETIDVIGRKIQRIPLSYIMRFGLKEALRSNLTYSLE